MPPLVVWGHASRPIAGEFESGDLDVVAPFDGGVLLAVVDGLGHGPEATAVSRSAASVLAAQASLEPIELMVQCHQALRGSRGAAMLVVSLSSISGRFSWAGVGNVEGVCVRRIGGPRVTREPLISAPGVVGYHLPTQRRREATLEPGDVFMLASDGITPRFVEDVAIGGTPDEIATAILATHGRTTDDALVLVARYDGGGV